MWTRPTILPLPDAVLGVAQPILSLNGTWQHLVDLPADFGGDAGDLSGWTEVSVPGQMSTRDRNRPDPSPCAYRKRVPLPADFAGKRIYLKLDGVSGYARLWVNRHYVRDHFGTYTPWCADITDCVSAGDESEIVLGVEARHLGNWHTEMSLLREIRLLALPPDHLTRLHVETDLDAAYRDATLKVHVGMAFHEDARAKVILTLRDAQGQAVPLAPEIIELSAEQTETPVSIPVVAPHLWDAEHPYLYTLEAQVIQAGTLRQTVTRQVGFRKIEIVARRLLVNGQEVKLRGVNRHDVYPLTGRSVTPELCALDARLFREANMNFVRTSHYPPNEAFLDACDREGLYVDDEIACMMVKDYEHNDPGMTPMFLGQFSEMIERDRSHPSVIMWSMANESAWGRNFQAQHDYARAEDPSRPLIFSWADLAPFGERPPFDIYSLHYAYYDADPSEMSDLWVGAWWNPAPGKNITPGARRTAQGNLPVLHDEVAHVPAYDVREQMRDPGVRNFWGETIKRFWERIRTTDGALGAAIWAGIDDLMILSERGAVGREWGVIDGWRRLKPEYWLAKKAYSPVHIVDEPLPNPGAGQALRVPVANWFDHTNLSELRIRWQVGDEDGWVTGTDVAPHVEGTLYIVPRHWQAGDGLNLQFFWRGDILVDEYNLLIAPPTRVVASPQGPAPLIEERAETILIKGADFELALSRATGLISQATYRGTLLIQCGPTLHLEGIQLPPWSLGALAVHCEEHEAVVDITGAYGPVEVRFELRIDGQGLITTHYTVVRLPLVPPLPKA
jgi:hypothetical protein